MHNVNIRPKILIVFLTFVLSATFCGFFFKTFSEEIKSNNFILRGDNLSAGSSSASGTPWLVGWDYRKSLTITGTSAGAQTDYPIKIVANKGSGTDSGVDVYMGSNVQDDFDDVRFTGSDGMTELDYYREIYTDGTAAVFWVEVDSIPASPSTTDIYAYYGNSGASTTSDAEEVFLDWEDFEGTSFVFDTAGGTDITLSRSSDTTAIEGSYVGVNSGTQGYKIKNDGTGSFSDTVVMVGGWVKNTFSGSTGNELLGPGFAFDGGSGSNAGYQTIIDLRNSVSPQIRAAWDYSSRQDGNYSGSTSTWYFLELYRDGNDVKASLWTESQMYGSSPQTTTTKSSDTTYSSGSWGLGTYNASSSAWDAARIRTYANPEPSLSSWGSEESFSGTNFSLVGDINPFADLSSSDNFEAEIGYSPRIRANTPRPPVLGNEDYSFDRLNITIDPSGNPSDTLYAVVVSSDGFSTYKYLQVDGTLGDELGTEDYRTYASYGGSSGSLILGLGPNKTYTARVKALHGDFTETGYSSDSNEGITTVPFVNMSVSETGLSMGSLNLYSISQTSTVTVTVNTNAYSGYQVYVRDSGDGVSGGLYDGASSLIESADATLSTGFEGYGAQASSLTATVDNTFNVSGNNVGGLDISATELFSNNKSVTGDSADITFKATMSPNTSAGEYSDTVYFTVTPNL